MASETKSKPPISGLLIALIVFGAGFAICGAGLLAIRGSAEKWIEKAQVPAIDGFGDGVPAVAQSGDWATYRFRDLGLQMELADEPRAGYMKVDASYILGVKGWAYYYLNGRSLGMEIWRYDYREKSEYAPSQIIQDHFDDSEGEVKETIRKIDGRTVSVGEVNEKIDGRNAKYGLVVLAADRSEICLSYTYYEDKTGENRKDLERVLKSIRFVN